MGAVLARASTPPGIKDDKDTSPLTAALESVENNNPELFVKPFTVFDKLNEPPLVSLGSEGISGVLLNSPRLTAPFSSKVTLLLYTEDVGLASGIGVSGLALTPGL